jgi:hypothetical protein
MPGTNAGTGQPLTFKCAKCRITDWRTDVDLEATGRTRPMAHRGIRQTTRKIEYKCRICGHVGWTQHIDAERLLR